MEQTLNMKLLGPLSEESGPRPGLGDTVAVILTDGRVRLMSITGAIPTPEGMVLYATGGEKVSLTDCYLLITEEVSSVDQS